MNISFDVSSALLVAGFIFWLAGGGRWVAQKVRQLELENDKREQDLKLQEAKDLVETARKASDLSRPAPPSEN